MMLWGRHGLDVVTNLYNQICQPTWFSVVGTILYWWLSSWLGKKLWLVFSMRKINHMRFWVMRGQVRGCEGWGCRSGVGRVRSTLDGFGMVKKSVFINPRNGKNRAWKTWTCHAQNQKLGTQVFYDNQVIILDAIVVGIVYDCMKQSLTIPYFISFCFWYIVIISQLENIFNLLWLEDNSFIEFHWWY